MKSLLIGLALLGLVVSPVKAQELRRPVHSYLDYSYSSKQILNYSDNTNIRSYYGGEISDERFEQIYVYQKDSKIHILAEWKPYGSFHWELAINLDTLEVEEFVLDAYLKNKLMCRENCTAEISGPDIKIYNKSGTLVYKISNIFLF